TDSVFRTRDGTATAGSACRKADVFPLTPGEAAARVSLSPRERVRRAFPSPLGRGCPKGGRGFGTERVVDISTVTSTRRDEFSLSPRERVPEGRERVRYGARRRYFDRRLHASP